MTGPYNRTPTTALQKALSGLPPLPGSDPPLQFMTLHVDSVTGNDDNPGTAALPYRTLARAWYQRLQYLELRVVLTIQLHGVGPYDMPPMGASECAANGWLVIKGDQAAETVVASGTFTGDIAGQVLPTSATGGTNNLRDEFLRVTSGPLAGALFQITENAANSITIANKRARSVAAVPIVNGDAWQCVRPGTQIRITLNNSFGPHAQTPHVISNWRGVTRGNNGEPLPKHQFFDVRFITSDNSGFSILDSQVGLTMCRCERGVGVRNSLLVTGMMFRSDILGYGAAGQNCLPYGAGLVALTAGSIAVATDAQITGVLSWLVTFSVLAGAFTWLGGRAGSGLFLFAGAGAEDFGTDQDNLVNATISISSRSLLRTIGGPWRAAVTAGSVVRVDTQGYFECRIAFTGGTTDAAGYGCDVRSGGRALYKNVTPALTGGTAGSDLRTTNVAVAANAALNANGNAVGNATDALLGEVLARVA